MRARVPSSFQTSRASAADGSVRIVDETHVPATRQAIIAGIRGYNSQFVEPAEFTPAAVLVGLIAVLVDFVAVAGEHIALKRAGRRYITPMAIVIATANATARPASITGVGTCCSRRAMAGTAELVDDIVRGHRTAASGTRHHLDALALFALDTDLPDGFDPLGDFIVGRSLSAHSPQGQYGNRCRQHLSYQIHAYTSSWLVTPAATVRGRAQV